MAAAHRRTVAIFALLLAPVVDDARAVPAPPLAWVTNGIPISSSAAAQYRPEVVTDGQGGAYVCWIDTRYVYQGMFAQHVDAMGVSTWDPAGVALNGALVGYDPHVVPAGASHATLVWRTPSDVRLGILGPWGPEFVGDAGTPSATAARNRPGNAVDPSAIAKYNQPRFPAVLPVSPNDAYVLLEIEDLRLNSITLTRLAGGGLAPGWEDVNFPEDPASGGNFGPVMCTDGADGVIVAWSWGVHGMGAQRVTPAGGLVEGWPGRWPARIDTVTSRRSAAGIVPDGAGGAIVVWADRRDPSRDQLFAQRLDASGTVAQGWPSDGRLICAYPTAAGILREAESTRSYASVVSDGEGGGYVAWSDARADAGDIYVQRLTPEGIAGGWPAHGRPIATAPGFQSRPVLVADGAGGAILAWEDRRSGGVDVYAHRILPTGQTAAGWPTQGAPICTVSGDQLHPRLADDGQRGAILAWEDHRGATSQIYAVRIDGNGLLPVHAVAVPPAAFPRVALDPLANPTRGPMDIAFTLDGGFARLELLDLAGRSLESHDVGAWGAGVHTVRLSRGVAPTPGMYFVRLLHARGAITRRLVVVR